ncbi:hypothetical protein LJ655_03625 [Paraburkholderia sp. MMS20-SJTN17]|uniref:Uncharacterized protein n=1 Tax=Paraburkholderia translucens TaxID=2886945 RepID=A0ABS8K8B6_9BURK|nr:hypothetical protein [Paraburkholderia sp. MMS20-SJTN17]MCC8400991.1 hypothetical protein [Paraburkholderia sp. MMS20-SJTN17]
MNKADSQSGMSPGIGMNFDFMHGFDHLPTRVLPRCAVNQTKLMWSGDNNPSKRGCCRRPA